VSVRNRLGRLPSTPKAAPKRWPVRLTPGGAGLSE